VRYRAAVAVVDGTAHGLRRRREVDVAVADDGGIALRHQRRRHTGRGLEQLARTARLKGAQAIVGAVVARIVAGHRLAADRAAAHAAQADDVVDVAARRVGGDRSPQHQRLVRHPPFRFRHRGTGIAEGGGPALQGGVDAGDVEADVSTGLHRIGADTTVGHVQGRNTSRAAAVVDHGVHVDAAAGRGGRTAVAWAAAAGAERAGAAVPVVQLHAGRIAGKIYVVMHRLRRIQLLHTLVAVAVGVLGHQAHQWPMEEAVLSGRTAAGHKAVGARITVVAHLHHDVVERRGGDRQRVRRGGRQE